MNDAAFQRRGFWESFYRNQAGWYGQERKEIPPNLWEIEQSVPMEAISGWADAIKNEEGPVDLYIGEAALSSYGKKIYRETLQFLSSLRCSFIAESLEIKILRDESGFLSHKAHSFFLLTSNSVIAGRMAVLLKSRVERAYLFCSSLLGEETSHPCSFVLTVGENKIFSWTVDPERYALPPWNRIKGKSGGQNLDPGLGDKSLILWIAGLLRSLAEGKSVLSSVDEVRKYWKNLPQLK